MFEDGYRSFLEVGPYPLLAQSIKECLQEAGIVSRLKECILVYCSRLYKVQTARGSGRSVALPSHEEAFISGLAISEYLSVEYPFANSPQAQNQYAFVKNFLMGEQGKYDGYSPFKE
jgi:hypothetical protein